MVLACITMSFHAAHAQQPPLSLSDAWTLAAANYPGINHKKAGIKAATYEQKITRSSMLPQAKMQLQNTYGTFNGSSGAFFPQPGFFNVSGNTDALSGAHVAANTFGSVMADWNLYSFGRQRKNNEAAALQVAHAHSDMDAYLLELKSNVAARYFNMLYTHAKLSWATKNSVRVKEILDLSVNLADAGLKPGADTLLAASSYAQILSDEDHWTGKETASRYQLTEYIADSIAGNTLHNSAYLTPAGDIPAAADSIRQHPYLEVIDTDIRYHQVHSEALGRAAYPSLSLLGGVAERGTGIGKNGVVSNNWQDGFKNGAGNYLVGVGITWNLTGIYSTNLQKKVALQQADAAKSQYDQQALQLNTGLHATMARITEQMQQVRKTQTGVQKATEGYELYLARYQSGLINLSELLQIQLLLQQAENTHIEACREFWELMITNATLTGDFSYLSRRF
ncbi:hypothetical protein MMC2321_01460 [Chitinophaga sp. MM2321]